MMGLSGWALELVLGYKHKREKSAALVGNRTPSLRMSATASTTAATGGDTYRRAEQVECLAVGSTSRHYPPATFTVLY
jgi:hypothetical protein